MPTTTTKSSNWQHQAITLHNTQLFSWREIATKVGEAKSTVSDYLRTYASALSPSNTDSLYVYKAPQKAKKAIPESVSRVFNIATDINKQEGTHLFISDTQVKPGVDMSYLSWLGQYIVRKQPDVIIHVGDHADMPSLSSYDKGKKTAEGKRVSADIESAIDGMRLLLKPLYELQQQQLLETGKINYKPRLVLTLGNHEDRINRHVDSNPELHGFLSVDDLLYEDFGWEVVPFLTPIEIGGIFYCHYFPNVMTGKALTGTAGNMLKVIGKSFSMGHRQVLDISTRFIQADGTQQWGLVSGAYYGHQEAYKGVQGNHHWRGVVLKHNVKNGSYDPLFVSMDWLQKEYS